MTNDIKSTVVKEEKDLYNNAITSLLVAAMFIFDYLDKFQEPLIKMYTLIYVLYGIAFIAIFILLIRNLIKAATRMSKKNFWVDNYEDEYFNYINNKGYKYLCCTLLIYLTIFSIFGKNFESIPIDSFCKFGAALGFFTYGLTVILLLKSKDD
jgi:hypothetical protein